jgi:Na+-translocating ferredoxin:NAD+ oxidoreductase RnfA subunit
LLAIFRKLLADYTTTLIFICIIIKCFIQIRETMLNKEKQSKYIGLGIAIGTALGAILGQVIFNNLALGIGLGISLGAAIGALVDRRS